MSGKTIFKIIATVFIIIIDYIVSNTFDYFMLLFNSKSAVQELRNSDSAYLASHILQIKPWLFYIVLIAINIIIFGLMYLPKKNKNKEQESEELYDRYNSWNM